MPSTATERPEWTNGIQEWSLDAAEEPNSARYFLVRDAVAGLANGNKAIITGRKGTGKTALIKHLSLSCQLANQQISNFELQDFGVFHGSKRDIVTSELDTDLFARWQITILAELAKLMLHSRNVDGAIKSELKDALKRSPSDLIRGESTITTGKALSFHVLGHGMGGAQHSEVRGSARTLSERGRDLSNYLCDHIDGTAYFILIDGIDSNYTPVTEALGEEYFYAYARALVRAALSIRRSFAATNRAKVYPIVAIRSDIYRRIQDSDKGKWEDLTVDLRWNEDQLEQLADFRVARLEDKSVKRYDVAGSFARVYRAQTYQRKRIFAHLCHMSFLRPRDVVSFVRLSFDHSTWPIANAAMPHLFGRHSNYLRQEVVDEAHVAFPTVDNMLGALEQVGKPVVTTDDLKEHYFGGNRVPIEEAIKLSVQYNLLGVQRKRGAVFAYQDDYVRPLPSSELVVHPGLRPSLHMLM